MYEMNPEEHFLPRNAIRKRGTSRQPLSVRPSVCHTRALRRNTKDVKLFLDFIATSLYSNSFFRAKRLYTVARELHKRGRQVNIIHKIAIFSYILQTAVHGRPTTTVEC